MQGGQPVQGEEWEEEDEEMTAAERDLADDAQWKLIQKNTFSRWANEHLKTVNKQLADLEADFADGLRLVSLIEVLSGKKFKHVNKRPNFRTQKLENVTMVLEFLERDEGIRIVNIDSTDIVDRRLKLILGLIWTLILHYSISMPMWEGEEPTPSEGGPTPKQRLLNWIQSKVPDLPIKNFTSDWNDGRAIGALVDALAPGLCPDWEDWDPKKGPRNAKEAMEAAEKWLDVPQLIKPEELTNPKVDEMSMMTYLAQFPHAKVKPGAPVRPKLNAGRVRAWGPGIEPTGNHKGAPARFTVETFSAGKGDLEPLVLNPRGQKEPCEVVFNDDRNQTFSCCYVPSIEGNYKVIVKYGGKEIPKSPFNVMVEGAAGDPAKVKAYGPGIERSGNMVNKTTYFEVDVKEAGEGNIDVVILDPQGHKESVRPAIGRKDATTFHVEYTPIQPGLHSVNVFFAGAAIPNSPYGVGVSPACDPKQCSASGRGLQPKGVRVRDEADFKVFTKGAGDGDLRVQVVGPGGREEKVTMKQIDNDTCYCVYVPLNPGHYVINITYSGVHIPRSPFKVEVGPYKETKIRAYGPGLEGGVVNQPAVFTVETNGETGALGFSIEGPSKAKIDTKDNGDGSADVTYWPTQAGDYAVHILCNDEDIPKSPYIADIRPATNDFDAGKVTAQGPGLERTGVVVGQNADFIVDARNAGNAPLKITCLDVDYHSLDVQIQDNRDGTFACRYVARRSVKHTITITYGGVNITNSPFRVYVQDMSKPDKVRVYGPGVERGIKTFVKTYFVVDCKNAGPGDVAIALTDEQGRDVPVNTIDNDDGTFTVEYEPQTVGVYTVNVYFADKEIPQSPIKVKVEPSIDLSKVRVEGLEPKIKVGEAREVRIFPPPSSVDTEAHVFITTPAGEKVELPVNAIQHGYACAYALDKPGVYIMNIVVAGQEVPQTPYKMEAILDIGAVKVEGLEPKIPAGKPQEVHIIIPKGTKLAEAKFYITAPGGQKAEIPVEKAPHGYTSKFALDIPGKYVINITYAGVEVPQTPFNVEVVVGVDVSQVRVEGLKPKIPIKVPHEIQILPAPGMPRAETKVFITSPSGQTAEIPTSETPNGYTSTFALDQPGPYTINVQYAGSEVPQTPYKFEAIIGIDVSQVKVEGLEPKIPAKSPHQIRILPAAGMPRAVVKVFIIAPNGQKAEIPTSEIPEGYMSTFALDHPGKYTLSVLYGDSEVPQTPYVFEVVPGVSEVPVVIEGLQPKIPTKTPHEIKIITPVGEPKKPASVKITNPSGQKAELPTTEVPEGFVSNFALDEPGPYTLNVEYGGSEVPQTPYKFEAVLSAGASNVRIEGLQPKIPVKKPHTIKIVAPVDEKKKAPAKVTLTAPNGQKADIPTSECPDGYDSNFSLDEPGPYVLNVTYDNEEVPQTPYNFEAVPSTDANAIKVEGLEPKIPVKKPHKITVIVPEGIPKAPIKVAITSVGGQKADIPCTETPEGNVSIFALDQPGKYTLDVTYGDQAVPQTPFNFEVMPANKAPNVKVEGLKPQMAAKCPHEIKILPEAGSPKEHAHVTLTNPKGDTEDVPTSATPEGYTCSFSPEETGPYTLDVFYGGEEVQQTPYKFEAVPGTGADAVRVEGLQPKIPVKAPHEIKILTPIAEPKAPAKVTLTAPSGAVSEIPVAPIPAGYDCKFAIAQPGPYILDVKYDDKEVPQTPYKFEAVPASGPNSVRVEGLEPKIPVNKPHEVKILVPKGIPKKPAKVILTSKNGQTSDIPTTETPEGHVTKFALDQPGPYTLNVMYGEKEVPQTPYRFEVMPEEKAPNVRVEGLEPKMTINCPHQIKILPTPGTPRENAKVSMTNPAGQQADIPVSETPDGYACKFALDQPGPYTLNVFYGGKEVPETPFKFDAVPGVDAGPVRIEGLKKTIKAGEPQVLKILTPGAPTEEAQVLITPVEGQMVPVPVSRTPEGFESAFAVDAPGEYTVDVTYGGTEVAPTPFKINAVPGEADIEMVQAPVAPLHSMPPGRVDASKVRIEGLEKRIKVSEPQDVRIITKDAGKAEPKVTITAPNGQTAVLPTVPTDEGHSTRFALDQPGKYELGVTYGGKEVPQSPVKFEAVPDLQSPLKPGDVSKVKAYGAGLKGGEPEKPAEFTIDTRESGPGPLGITVEGPAEAKINFRDNQDGTCDVKYLPPVEGDYKINIKYEDQPIPGSPFTASIAPGNLDVSGITVTDMDKGVFTEAPSEFTVDARPVTKTGAGQVRAVVSGPSSTRYSAIVKNKEDGLYDVMYTPMEEGPHKIDVTYENLPIPNSPFEVNAVPGCDASRVKAYGPGLDGALTNQPAEFTISTKGAGKGGLGLLVEGPSEAQMTCKDNHDGTCRVEYMPTKPGDYNIGVKFADQDIPGSPFKVTCKNPVDAEKVKVYGPGVDSKKGVRASQPAQFTVDTKDAGEAPLEAMYTDQNGVKRPVNLVPVEEGVYNATYVPSAEGKCKVDVTYDGKHVPNSPFQTRILPKHDASKVRVDGPGIGDVTASLPVSFNIDARDAGIADLEVMIQRPDGSLLRPVIEDNGDGTFKVTYTPDDAGPYKIKVKYGGEEVPGAPFRVNAHPTGDASRCRITEGLDTPVMVNKETVITVDASEAGVGKVTCRIRSPNGTEIDIDILDNADGTFQILFTPQYPGTYTIAIQFGGQPVPQGDYEVQVGEDLIRVDTAGDLQSAAPGAGLYHPVDFCIPVGPIFNFISAYVTMPSGKKAYPKIEDNGDGTVTVRYQPSEMGLHELHVLYNQEPIDGSPFQFHVDALSSGYITAYGTGLTHGTAGVPAEFTINTKEAGAGGLDLSIEGPSKAEIECKDNGDGTCKVTYYPTVPGEYKIAIKFQDKHIMGSPFTPKITGGKHKKKSQVSVGSSTEVSLKVTETDIGSLTASIRSPSGKEEPCILKKLPNGHLGISFTPREKGEHLVSVYRNGKHIPNSPFRIDVGEGEVGNASKVKAYGPGLKEGQAKEVNEFTVNTKEAGYGGLSLSIEGPSKADIECHDNEDGTLNVTYRPTEPGSYIINIKFADEHIPGSPFTVRIAGEPTVRLTEQITRHRDAADVTKIGSQCELSLKIPGTTPFDMTASVTSPNGVTEMCDVIAKDDNRYSIKFVPKEIGLHVVSVKHKDMHIPGSPFEFTVGPMAGGGAHKVHASGPGLQKGEVNTPCDFNIYTREGGAGGLSIAIEGPSKAEIKFEDRKDGSCGVSYFVQEPGDYLVSIKFNDAHIPDSPFRVPISPPIGDAKKLSVQSLQEKGLQVGRPAAFTVNFNGAKGELTAKVVAPSGAEDEALIQEVDDGQYAVRFIPRENGVHYVHVFFNGCHIPGSPFRIMVGRVDADPGKVKAYGDGLSTGRTDKVCKFFVNTTEAGSGALAVTVEGPSKVKLDCEEGDEGYEFTYTPTAPGDYYITIRYAGINIVGSPFKAVIEGQGRVSGLQEQSSVVVETVTKTSTMTKFKALGKFDTDASKVEASGNGLMKAYRGKSGTFTLETLNAGNNILFVGMMGPKGPCEELIVKRTAPSTYTVSYIVKEKGSYMLVIKWGEEHIPGSPYCVEVI